MELSAESLLGVAPPASVDNANSMAPPPPVTQPENNPNDMVIAGGMTPQQSVQEPVVDELNSSGRKRPLEVSGRPLDVHDWESAIGRPLGAENRSTSIEDFQGVRMNLSTWGDNDLSDATSFVHNGMNDGEDPAFDPVGVDSLLGSELMGGSMESFPEFDFSDITFVGDEPVTAVQGRQRQGSAPPEVPKSIKMRPVQRSLSSGGNGVTGKSGSSVGSSNVGSSGDTAGSRSGRLKQKNQRQCEQCGRFISATRFNYERHLKSCRIAILKDARKAASKAQAANDALARRLEEAAVKQERGEVDNDHPLADGPVVLSTNNGEGTMSSHVLSGATSADLREASRIAAQAVLPAELMRAVARQESAGSLLSDDGSQVDTSFGTSTTKSTNASSPLGESAGKIKARRKSKATASPRLSERNKSIDSMLEGSGGKKKTPGSRARSSQNKSMPRRASLGNLKKPPPPTRQDSTGSLTDLSESIMHLRTDGSPLLPTHASANKAAPRRGSTPTQTHQAAQAAAAAANTSAPPPPTQGSPMSAQYALQRMQTLISHLDYSFALSMVQGLKRLAGKVSEGSPTASDDKPRNVVQQFEEQIEASILRMLYHNEEKTRLDQAQAQAQLAQMSPIALARAAQLQQQQQQQQQEQLLYAQAVATATALANTRAAAVAHHQQQQQQGGSSGGGGGGPQAGSGATPSTGASSSSPMVGTTPTLPGLPVNVNPNAPAAALHFPGAYNLAGVDPISAAVQLAQAQQQAAAAAAMTGASPLNPQLQSTKPELYPFLMQAALQQQQQQQQQHAAVQAHHHHALLQQHHQQQQLRAAAQLQQQQLQLQQLQLQQQQQRQHHQHQLKQEGAVASGGQQPPVQRASTLEASNFETPSTSPHEDPSLVASGGSRGGA